MNFRTTVTTVFAGLILAAGASSCKSDKKAEQQKAADATTASVTTSEAENKPPMIDTVHGLTVGIDTFKVDQGHDELTLKGMVINEEYRRRDTANGIDLSTDFNSNHDNKRVTLKISFADKKHKPLPDSLTNVEFDMSPLITEDSTKPNLKGGGLYTNDFKNDSTKQKLNLTIIPTDTGGIPPAMFKMLQNFSNKDPKNPHTKARISMTYDK